MVSEILTDALHVIFYGHRSELFLCLKFINENHELQYTSALILLENSELFNDDMNKKLVRYI